MADDIFSPANKHSFIREAFKTGKQLHVDKLPAEPFVFTPDYATTEHHFSTDRDTYRSEIHVATDNIIHELTKNGYPQNLKSAIYETILNAHQHGNDLEPDKTVTLGWKADDTLCDIVVADQGGTIRAPVQTLISQYREMDETKFINFYEDSGEQISKQKENLGTGTYFMHQYTDEVHYYKTPEDGLAVQLRKYR